MRSASLYRMSGYCLILGALLSTVAMLLLPQGGSSPAEVVARLGPRWMSAGALLILGNVLLIAGAIGIYRHFVGGEQEGWALLAAVACATGLITESGGMAIGTLGLSGLHQMVLTTGALATGQPAEGALISGMGALAAVGGTLGWLALVPLGVAMRRDVVWSKFVARGAIAFGVVEAVGGFLVTSNRLAALMLMILGFAYVALLGNAVIRIPRAAPVSPARTAEVGGGVRPGDAGGNAHRPERTR